MIHPDGSVDLIATAVFTGATPCGTGTWTQALAAHASASGTFTGTSVSTRRADDTIDPHTAWTFNGAETTFSCHGNYRCE